jgi:hypothetical protein
VSKIIKLLVLLSFTAVYSPVHANDYYHLNNIQQGEAYAGAYLSFKFGNNSRTQNKQKLRYGLSAGLRQQNLSLTGNPSFNIQDRFFYSRNNSLFAQSHIREIRVFDTNFDSEGFKSLNFANVPMYKRGVNGELEFIRLGLDGDEEGEGRSTGSKVALWTLGILAGAAVLLLVVPCLDNEEEGSIGDRVNDGFCAFN